MRTRAPACIALLAFTAACGPSTAVDAPVPAPALADTVDTLPTLPPSLVDAPLAYDLAPALAALEAAVPRRFGDINARRRHTGNRRVHTAFTAEREAFTVRFDGNTVRISTVLHYQGRGWYDPGLGADVVGSCGFTLGQERPRAVVEIATTVRLTNDWRLRGRTNLTRVEPFSTERRDQCKVTIFNVDVTERVLGAAREALENKLVVLDTRIAATNVRGPVERWWHLLQRPIRLSDSVWLLLRPTGVHLGPVKGVGRTLEADIGLAGEPRVVTGRRPADGASPLPPLETATETHAHGLHVLLEGHMGYDVANAILTRNVGGKRIRRGARVITIRDAKLSGIGGGRIALAVRFDGTASGVVYLVGTPRYDPASDELYVPDLEFDVGSADMLVRGLAWMKRGEVQQFLRSRARFPVGDLVERARARLERGMNRRLGQNAALESKVTAGEVLAVRATPEAILVRARAEGSARLLVNKAPTLTRR